MGTREYTLDDLCPMCGGALVGTLLLTMDCACHISPPCIGHSDPALTCEDCGWETDEDGVGDPEDAEEVLS